MSWHYTLGEIAQATGGAVDPAHAALMVSAVSTDTRKISSGQLFFGLRGERFDGNAFVGEAFARGASAAVCTEPNAAGPCILVPDALRALQQFAAWHRGRITPRVFGVTGSCGKTTTKDFVHALISTRFNACKTQGNLNNDIGVPLTLLELSPEVQFAIVEMGANHVGEIRDLCALARPHESAVTLVAPAHLEGFGSIERIAQAKFEIAEGLEPGGTFYVNMDNPFTRAMGEKFPGPKIRFGAEGDVVIRAINYDDAGEMLLDLDPVGRLRLPLPVKAHAHNVALAVAVALQNGVTEFEGPLREAASRSARFKTTEAAGLEVFDDTYNANPASMVAAIESLGLHRGKGRKLAALGCMLEMGEEAPRLHRAVGEAAAHHKVDALFARGPYAADIVAGAKAAGLAHAQVIDKHEDIAREILAIAAPGDTLLLKGSRGMRMEGVLEALRALSANTEAGGS